MNEFHALRAQSHGVDEVTPVAHRQLSHHRSAPSCRANMFIPKEFMMNQRPQFRLIALTLLLVAIVAMPILQPTGAAFATGTNTIAIGDITAQPGSTGSFTIGLENADAVAAGEIRFVFAPAPGIAVTNIDMTDRLNGFSIDKTINTSDPQQTKVSILFFNLSGLKVAAGSGAILTVSYTTDTDAAGSTALTLTKGLLSDAAGNPLPVTLRSGTFAVETAPTPTHTPTPEPTATDTSVPTGTNTPEPTITHTPTPTNTDTPRPPTHTATATATPETATVIPTATTPTATPDHSVTDTPTASPTPTPTPTQTPDNRDDLFAFDYELWTEPLSPAAEEAVKVGIVVHRLRGKATLADVAVQLAVTGPTGTQSGLGKAYVPLLGTHTQETSSYQQWTPAVPGEYVLYARLDPDDQIAESDETNNVITRTITVLPAAADRVPPRLTGFTINDGEAATTTRTVTLRATATDPQPGSGVHTLRVIEFEFLLETNRWTPVTTSAWFDYDTWRQGVAWDVTEGAGVKYLQVWAVDGARNISAGPAKAYINYQPPTKAITQDDVHFYRYQLQQGERLTVQLTAADGDPDLYIWGPDYETRPPWVSREPEGTDLVTFAAPIAGTYQVEVHGYSSADYQLTVNITADGVVAQEAKLATQQQQHRLADKPERNQPLVALISEPGIYVPSTIDLPNGPNATPTGTATPTVTPTATATAMVTATTTPSATPDATPIVTRTPVAETPNDIYLPVIVR